LQPDEDFWDDLLGHLREQVLVPVVGPELVTVADGDRRLPLAQLIGERLAARYKLTVDGGVPPSLNAAVRAYFADRGRGQDERLYRVVNDLLGELNPQPGEALKHLAAVTDLNLFISTTFDGLLARAIDDVRFGGQAVTQQMWFSPSQSTDVQERNAHRPGAEPVVFKLFGEASSLPQFAVHDEDTLEWLHALLSETARLPDWVEHQLKERPLLLLGCQMPDWIGRFLVRLASTTRLSMARKQFFIVGRDISHHPELGSFFRTYCSPSSVQVVEQDPEAFVAELHRRWLARQPAAPAAGVPAPAATAPTAPGSIFISYVREDAEAARRLADAVTGLGGDVWLDQRRLQPGDRWEAEILSSIRRGIRLFVPLISKQTESREEGYVFKEWAEAAERARGIPGRRFIVPVVIDEDYDGNPARYRMTPESFRQFHFGTAPGGRPNGELLAALTEEIRSMRRAGTP
jgi:hypothetical protein